MRGNPRADVDAIRNARRATDVLHADRTDGVPVPPRFREGCTFHQRLQKSADEAIARARGVLGMNGKAWAEDLAIARVDGAACRTEFDHGRACPRVEQAA